MIERRDSIVEDANVSGTVVNSRLIGDINFILVRNGNTCKIMYDSAGTYIQLGNTRYANSSTPYSLESGMSARGLLRWTGIKIGDAFLGVNSNYDGNNGNMAYSNVRTYLKDNIVLDAGVYYVSIAGSIWQAPPNATYWSVYDPTKSGIATLEPTRNYTDEFEGKYRVLRLKGTGVRSQIAVNDYICFYENKSGLQWVASKIKYIDSTLYIEWNLPNDPNDVIVYIETTNKYGRWPYFNSNTSLTEQVAVYSGIGEVPVIATEDGVYSYNIIEDWLWSISTAHEIQLLSLTQIEDLTTYNGNLFVVNDKKTYFSSRAWETNVNFHLFDFIPVIWGKRLIPFGKMLLLLWAYDKVITPVKITGSPDSYSMVDLNFEEDIYSKYSAISYMGSLYMIKKNRILVKVDVVVTSNNEYSIQTTDVMNDIKGLLDDVSWEVYLQINSKNLTVFNHVDWGTKVYNYNFEYEHWSTQSFAAIIHKIVDDTYYGNKIYKVGWVESFEQKIGMVFWVADLFKLKQFMFMKFIFGIKEQQLDYFLDVEWHIGWIKQSVTVALDNYNINLAIADPIGGLGDSMIGTTLLGTEVTTPDRTIGDLCTVNVGIAKTASLMRFTLRSKINNWFIYGGSILWYETCLAELTEVGYKH